MELDVRRLVERADVAQQPLREPNHPERPVVEMLRRETSRRHVGVPDCLDFLDSLALRALVEHRKHFVEHRDDFFRRHLAAYFREADDVGKKDGDVRVFLRDGAFRMRRKLLRDFLREDVQEKMLRAVLFRLKLPRALLHGALKLAVLLLDADELSLEQHDRRRDDENDEKQREENVEERIRQRLEDA